MNDPLDELLARPPAADDGKLRQEILQGSTAILRRRRYVKQLLLAATLPACFLAGMVTMRWFGPAPQQQLVYVEIGAKKEALPTPGKEPPLPTLSAVVMENKALDSPDHRADLYRQAAELYLKEGDYASWVRCKDNALSEAKKEDLQISPDDDFLTIALKKERQKKENRDARTVD
jgi:hypothetical protein